MAKKGTTRNKRTSGRSGSKRRKQHYPESREKKALEARRKELRRRLRKEIDPLERRYLERQIEALNWELQRLRASRRA